ncbi:MAG: long-chain fatty acid--CoA ligase [Thaumarchaeota archaeon]|nr:long-chain fatty acid--CoA ligase [Nitrososphaerota archaeon]
MEIQRPWLKSQPPEVYSEEPPPSKPVHSLLSDSAKRSPNRTSVHYQGRSFSYSQVDDLSSRFATALASLGVKSGDRVALFLPNIPQFVISYFGILKAGAIAVPCNPLYKELELEHQLLDSGAEVIVAANDIVKGNDLFRSLELSRPRLKLRHVIATSVTDYLPPLKRRLAFVAGVKNVRRDNTLDFVTLVKSSTPMAEPARVDPKADLAQLQYTGGTTGVSKGAMLTHYNLYSNAIYMARYLPMRETDVSLAVLPLYHIYGLSVCMNAPLSVGGETVLLPSFHVEEVMKIIQKRKVTLFSAVPTMYMAINNNPKSRNFDLRSVRACVSGGAALPGAVRKNFNELTGGNLVEGYGLSETSPVTHCNPVSGGVVKDGSIGVPFPETDAAIVDIDDAGKFLPQGSIGEVVIKGPQVMKGYWNQGAETTAAFRGGWFLTGDIGRMDEDGYFYIVDRKKDMINVGGFKVYPRDVEEVLFSHPAIREASVIGMPDSFSGEGVKAFVVLKDPAAKLTEAEVIAYCSEKLAKFKVPKKVEFVKELPKTLIGKVLRRKLREPPPQ